MQVTPGHLKNTTGVALQVKQGPRLELATHARDKVELDQQSTVDTWKMNGYAQPGQRKHEAVEMVPQHQQKSRQRMRQTKSRSSRQRLSIFQKTMPQKPLQYLLLQYLNLDIDQDETHA